MNNARDPQTTVDLFLTAFKTFSAKTAFSCMGQSLTYGDLDRYSARFASYLQHHTNLKAGDRVAVQLANVLQYPVVMFGVLRAGMVLVNTNPLYTKRELLHQLNDSGARLLVVMANVADTAAAIIEKTGVEQVVVTEVGDLHGFPRRLLINVVARHIKKMVPEFSFPQRIGFLKTLKLGETGRPDDQPGTPEGLAVLQYTGGTTGVAKGAMLSHSNLVANCTQVQQAMKSNLSIGSEIYIAPLPLYHIYALMIHCLLLVATGNHTVLIPNPRDLNGLVKTIKKYPFTGFVGLNTLFNGLCHHKKFRQLDFRTLKLTTSGGMALTSDVAHLWQQTTGSLPVEGYGLTETSPVVSFNPPDDIRLGTVGLPVINTEVVLMDDKGQPSAENEPGELWIRGPQVMQGYWQRPEETAEVLTPEGWFKTGDIAVITEDGYIKIVDRKKDMILVSGFNVYPNEIEEEVGKMPGVMEAAVIGIPSEATGEAVKLFVVRKDSSLTEKEIIRFCRERLTGYKIPHQIEFRESLPKSNVGKVLRKELR